MAAGDGLVASNGGSRRPRAEEAGPAAAPARLDRSTRRNLTQSALPAAAVQVQKRNVRFSFSFGLTRGGLDARSPAREGGARGAVVLMSLIAIGPFRLDTHQRRLWRDQQEIGLRPKSLAVLEYLAEHPGRLITKRELLQSVWPDTAVSDTVLRVCVREIRAALGDRVTTPRFIETIGRRGYQFAATAFDEAPVFGREEDLRRLHGWLGQALSGDRQMVFVSGEAGIGKTTLLSQFLAEVRRTREARGASSQCVERFGAGEAYLPALDLLGRLCRGPDGQHSIDVLGRLAPTWLLQMPGLLDDARLQAVRGRVNGGSRDPMLREIAEAVEALSTDHGLVLVLEDLHWSDLPTAELISYLAQRPDPAQLLLIASYRPAVAAVRNHPLSTIRRELQARGLCHELRLAPLTEQDIAQYLASRFAGTSWPKGLPQLIYVRTEGNPLFVVRMLDCLIQQGKLVDDGRHLRLVHLSDGGIPESVRGLITKELDALGRREVNVLEAASVAGLRFTAAGIAECVGLSVPQVDELCSGLAGKDLFLHPAGDAKWPDGTVSGCYTFRHALHRDALYERLPAARRVDLHRLIAERTQRAFGARASEITPTLAKHFEAAGNRLRAARYRLQAGEDALRRGARREAMAHLRRTLRLLSPISAGASRAGRKAAVRQGLRPRLKGGRRQAIAEIQKLCARLRRLTAHLDKAPQILIALCSLLGAPIGA